MLPKKEFELLYFMAQFPHRVFTREELLEHVWDANVLVAPQTVDVHILKIRQKIGTNYINTIKGKGYQFIPQPTLNIY